MQDKDQPESASSEETDGFSRRDLFGAVAVAAAATGAGIGAGALVRLPASTQAVHDTSLPMDKPPVPGSEHYGTREEKWFATSCGQCTAGCGVKVRVVAGRAVRIEGNTQNPLNRGGIGPRGLSALQGLYDPDRLKGAWVREGRSLVPIPWDKAIALLVERLSAARATRADSVVIWTGRENGLVHDMWERFASAFGTPNFLDGRSSRLAPMIAAMSQMFGVRELPVYDWSRAEYVLSLEAGILEDSCQLVHLARSAADLHGSRAGRRSTIAHAGPYLDLSAHNADDWVRIQAGASAALAYGIAHILVRDGLYDTQFVKERTSGFEALSKFLADFTPARTSERTGIPERRVEELAKNLATRRPSFVYVDDRSLAFSNGLSTALAALTLNALLGAVGSILHTPVAPPFAKWPAVTWDDVAKRGLSAARLDGAGGAAFPFAGSVPEAMPDALTAATASVLILDETNPAYSRKQPERWKKALGQVPFIVSTSPYRDETVEALAHLVLPDATFLERWDDSASQPIIPVAVAGVRRPTVEPMFDTRATADVLLEVARGLGGSVAAAFPWKGAREALESRLRGLYDAKRGTVVEKSENAFYKALFDRGFWADPDAPKSTPKKCAFVPLFEEATWEGSATEFPLKLIAYRPVSYAEGSGANLPWLRQLRPRPGFVRNVTMATLAPNAIPGLKTGDALELETPVGTIPVIAHIDRYMAEGHVCVPMGLGHDAFGRWAKGRGSNVMNVLAKGAAPKTGANMPCATRARVRRASTKGGAR